MRVNIYTEEITDEVQIVEQGGFHGLRFYLESAPSLHYTANDDDRSAITFWGLSRVKQMIRQAVIRLTERNRQPKGINELTFICPDCGGVLFVSFDSMSFGGIVHCEICHAHVSVSCGFGIKSRVPGLAEQSLKTEMEKQ